MAPRLKPDAIGVDEMKRYLEEESDFDFELKVLHKLREFNVDCEHGGHYEDPITKKSREFDIRVRVQEEGMLNLFLAVECKNLRSNFPLLVSCVPRTREEAWHTIFHSNASSSVFADVRKITGGDSRYRPGEWVGKSRAQVGINLQNDVTSSDGETYDKWAQSLSSLHGMVQELPGLPTNGSVAMAVPILVVPTDRLWQVRYNSDGSRVADPEQVDQCAFYAGGFSVPFGGFGTKFSISHVEIMTFRGLMQFVAGHLRNENTMRSLMLGSTRLVER